MATGYEAESGQIQSAANHVRDVRDQVLVKINRLQGVLESLTSSWSGDAARAFDQLMIRWNQDEVKLRNALNDIATQLQQSGTTYRTTEAEQTAAMQRVASALDG